MAAPGTVRYDAKLNAANCRKITRSAHNLLRYYDPTLGRYVSADPLGLEVRPNLYLYVNARPTVGIDPFGLQGTMTGRFPINQYNRNVAQPYNSRYNNSTPPGPANSTRPRRLPPPEWYQRNDQQRRDFNDRLADELDQLGDRIDDIQERKKLKDKARELRDNPPPPPPPPPPMVCRIGDRPDGGPYMLGN